MVVTVGVLVGNGNCAGETVRSCALAVAGLLSSSCVGEMRNRWRRAVCWLEGWYCNGEGDWVVEVRVPVAEVTPNGGKA